MQHGEEAKDEAWIYNGQEEVPPTVRRVKIAENVTEIPDETFKKHPQLEEVILSSSVQVIGERAFCRCEKLKSILYQGIEKEEEEVGFPSNVKVIDRWAFWRCSLLARLVLNEGLERIGENAFNHCKSLTEVNIPSTVKVIDERAFYQCNLLARLVLNEGLERIRKATFLECESLTEVDIPSTVKVIDVGAFYYCKLLARLGLNEGLEEIGSKAFSDCYSLSHVRIPKSVKSLATNAFTKCSDLISIELPEEWSLNIDLSGCQSLVNVVGPVSVSISTWEEFSQSSKLGSLVNDEADLTHRLNHRFDNSPVNKLCYYQSYQSSEDAMAQLRSLMEQYQPLALAATTEMDGFGMTPLHVLSLSQTPNLDMLLAMMDASKKGHMVCVRDSFGSTPMDYLCLNLMPNSSKVIRSLFQTRFEQVVGGLDQFWKSAMLQAIDEILAGDWSLRKSKIGEVVRRYAQKETLSLLELCLWKAKIGEATTSKKVKIGEATSKKEQLLADRQRCRVMTGADFVVPHVLAFLDSN
eukprot:scaffold2220_cov75-Cylindrotheca_fusiformis.AAC.11